MPDQNKNLNDATIALIQNRRSSLSKLAQEANVTFGWLRKYAAGKIPDPSVNKVQSLYEALTGRPLIQ